MTLVAISLINQTNAECCPKYVMNHVCLGTPYEEDIPLDSTLPATDNNVYWIRNEADERRPKCMTRFCANGSASAVSDFCAVEN